MSKDTNRESRLFHVLEVMATITKELLKYGIKPIIVGGTAVEFYTTGGYNTIDIDVVAPRHDIIAKVLDLYGFKKTTGRHWYNEKYDIAIELPDNVLDGSIDKVLEVDINSEKVYIIGIEDIIIDRLCAYKFWDSKDDGMWAKNMLNIHWNEIDFDYLHETAMKKGVGDVLNVIINAIKSNKTNVE
ncbi:DUF6036 family nucleotidyltransferase [Thermoanaerobacter wiegelii]|uniref:DUF6036 domain-containing protein n=1 Tax=Thermoanaerobacter wiegelii Rt8.B1 TaxID=697303 RepID=G2MRZ7_9THEO|nr:DUF6036 family nucleotidyltransferase [Thermoanaerobacter wiegelii]AEM77743.1 hypothetical protein Thewi_0241 [Thermoanaerobacter wiegelii Rt8.B1]